MLPTPTAGARKLAATMRAGHISQNGVAKALLRRHGLDVTSAAVGTWVNMSDISKTDASTGATNNGLLNCAISASRRI